MSIVRRVADDLIKYGEVHRPKLGVRVGDLSPADAEVYGLTSMNGAEIVEVTPDSPAERAGIQIGDVVIGLNGKAVDNGGDLTESLSLYQPGDKVTLELFRDRKKTSVDVKLGEFEPGARVARNDAAPRVRGMDRLGFSVADLTPQMARRAGLDTTEGVVVTDVDRNSTAYRNGIAPTEIIEKFNGQTVKSAADLERLAEGVKPGQAVSLVVRLPNGTRNIINYRVAS
jgi:serine protease Do